MGKGNSCLCREKQSSSNDQVRLEWRRVLWGTKGNKIDYRKLPFQL